MKEKTIDIINLGNLPIIDKAEGLRLAGQNQDLANEILSLFMKDLTTEILAFNQLLAEKNYTDLQKRLHKLHGACCYSGTPRLKTCLYHIETLLKTNQRDDLAKALAQLTHEAEQLMTAYAKAESNSSQ